MTTESIPTRYIWTAGGMRELSPASSEGGYVTFGAYRRAVRELPDDKTPPCSCGGIQTDYGLAHRGTCKIMEWHDLQIITNVRLERAALVGELTALKKAALAFLAKHDSLESVMTDLFMMEHIRGRPYKGDDWKAELDALRSLAEQQHEPP